MDKKILHLCNSSPITRSYIDFINENFEKENHFFVVFPTSFIYDYPDNCLVITRKNAKFNYLKVLLLSNRASKIILHGFFYNRFITRLLTISPWNIKKCYWIIWGADLYDDINQVGYTKTLRYKSFFFFKKLIIKKIKKVCTLTKEETTIYLNFFNYTPQFFEIQYINPLTQHMLDNSKKQCPKTIRILIGNSATATNLHLEILNTLTKFSSLDIQLFVPLSYGDMDYANQVIEAGSRLFNDKFIPITNFLEPEDYANLIANIDIAIFNNKEQQGLGNIYALLYLEKKVYIRSDSPIWSSLHSQNFKMYDTLHLKSEQTESLLKKELLLLEKNRKIAYNNFFDKTILANYWSKVFND